MASKDLGDVCVYCEAIAEDVMTPLLTSLRDQIRMQSAVIKSFTQTQTEQNAQLNELYNRLEGLKHYCRAQIMTNLL